MQRLVAIFAALIILSLLAAFYFFGAPDWLMQGEPAPVATKGEPLSPVQEHAEAPLPNFDIVRVDPAGTSVIAGRAEPNAEVVIFANGKEIGRVKANGRGDWVAYIETPLKEGDQELTLVMKTADGREVRGTQTVVVAVPKRPGEAPLVVLSDDKGGSRVLQSPNEDPGMLLTLEAIDYSDKGEIIFSGKGNPGGIVRLYVDNQLIGDARVDDNGLWRLQPEEPIVPGVRQLRIDQIAEDGRVSARVELPFERAAPDGLVMAGGKVVVQPGNSLWRIARKLYGSGFQYTIIYEANKEQIRDPDLIYPGQVFEAPTQAGY